jgi:hypothetical protein
MPIALQESSGKLKPGEIEPQIEPVSGSAEPGVEGFEIVVSDPLRGVNAVEKGAAVVASGDPLDVSVGDLVVDPGEWTSVSPCDQSASLPVEIEPAVFEFVFA